MKFNPAPPTVMHIDLNSCFATIEQQANPLLRNKPVVVAAYTTPGGCILAASVEAKRLGVTTGVRVGEGKALCPGLVVLPSDPEKYRYVNRLLLALLSEYSPEISVRSIDEMVLNFRYTPKISMPNDKPACRTGRCQMTNEDVQKHMIHRAREIKKRIKNEIGEWLTVSVGIAPNCYLAKIAAGLHKPDGLDVLTGENIEAVIGALAPEELTGIKQGYGARIRRFGLTTVGVMLDASPELLVRAFGSRIGYDWWSWLHGWGTTSRFDRMEADEAKTIGHSYALGKPYPPSSPCLHQILCQLVEKTGRRLRLHGFRAGGVHVSCLFTDHSFWNHGEKQAIPIFTNRDIYDRALAILLRGEEKPVRILAVTCYGLASDLYTQMSILEGERRRENLTRALDAIEDRWGDFSVFPARMLAPIGSGLAMEQKVQDRIAFGGVRDLPTLSHI